MFRSQDQPDARSGRRRKRWTRLGAAAALCAVPAIAWFATYWSGTRKLSRDTRVVVRVSSDAVQYLTHDTVHEHFVINEEVEGATLTGTLEAVGDVRVLINPQAPPGTFTVRVEGQTTNDLIGVKHPVRFEGKGSGTFIAVQRMQFDGRRFEALDLHVEAEQSSKIESIEPIPGTPLGSTVRLIAARSARQALPVLDEIAREQIRETVGNRVSEMVRGTVERLNRTTRFEETIALLHPDAEDWKIQVASSDHFVQAALVPRGGAAPQLPEVAADNPAGIEVWLKLTRSERTAVRIAHHWDASHRLFRRYLPEDQARTLAHDLRVMRVGDWTRLHVGAEAAHSLRAEADAEDDAAALAVH